MNDAQRKIEPKVRVWPFVESPGELAARLHRALDDFDGDMIAAVRCVFIEEPALLAQSTPPQPCPWWSPLPCKALDECVSKGFCARDAAPDSAAPPTEPLADRVAAFVVRQRSLNDVIAAAQADAPTDKAGT
jgi:hypothetical protein